MLKKRCMTPERKSKAIRRLRAIGGQVRGLEKMLSADRYCLDILTQVSAIHEALRKVSKILMRNYLEVCATSAIRSKQTKIYDELMDAIYRYLK